MCRERDMAPASLGADAPLEAANDEQGAEGEWKNEWAQAVAQGRRDDASWQSSGPPQAGSSADDITEMGWLPR